MFMQPFRMIVMLADMKPTITKLGAFMTGIGGAFALFPTASFAAQLQQQSVQTRMYNNFRAAGDRLRIAQGKVEREQQETAKRR